MNFVKKKHNRALGYFLFRVAGFISCWSSLDFGIFLICVGRGFSDFGCIINRWCLYRFFLSWISNGTIHGIWCWEGDATFIDQILVTRFILCWFLFFIDRKPLTPKLYGLKEKTHEFFTDLRIFREKGFTLLCDWLFGIDFSC